MTGKMLWGMIASPLLALAVAGSGPALAASPAAAVAREAQAPTPGDLVRQFYAWYLGELRAGHEGLAAAAKMRAYFTDAEIAELRAHQLPDFDPVLLLPRPSSDWDAMQVRIGPTTYYHRQGLHDAYVEVRYGSHGDRWSIGLERTPAGWRIASIAL